MQYYTPISNFLSDSTFGFAIGHNFNPNLEQRNIFDDAEDILIVINKIATHLLSGLTLTLTSYTINISTFALFCISSTSNPNPKLSKHTFSAITDFFANHKETLMLITLVVASVALATFESPIFLAAALFTVAFDFVNSAGYLPKKVSIFAETYYPPLSLIGRVVGGSLPVKISSALNLAYNYTPSSISEFLVKKVDFVAHAIFKQQGPTLESVNETLLPVKNLTKEQIKEILNAPDDKFTLNFAHPQKPLLPLDELEECRSFDDFKNFLDDSTDFIEILKGNKRAHGSQKVVQEAIGRYAKILSFLKSKDCTKNNSKIIASKLARNENKASRLNQNSIKVLSFIERYRKNAKIKSLKKGEKLSYIVEEKLSKIRLELLKEFYLNDGKITKFKRDYKKIFNEEPDLSFLESLTSYHFIPKEKSSLTLIDLALWHLFYEARLKMYDEYTQAINTTVEQIDQTLLKYYFKKYIQSNPALNKEAKIDLINDLSNPAECIKIKKLMLVKWQVMTFKPQQH